MKLTGVCLVTNDVTALSEFYSRVLCVPVEGDHIHAELKTEGAGMAIFSAVEMENMAPGSMHGAGGGNFTITFAVEDVDAEYARLKAMDIEFVKLPTTHPWGWRSFWFRDPEGNIVNFAAKVC